MWPDPDRREDALQRLAERVAQPRRSGVRLTPHQVRCLQAASHGLQAHETAEAFGVGVESVKTHLKLARRALAAKTTTQAVAEALRQGLME
jgi:DNA-binding CsgD family transcriptional regulator